MQAAAPLRATRWRWPARGLPVVTRSERAPAPPPPSLKASGELQEKVPRVYTHMRTTIFGERRRAQDGGVSSDYVEAPPPYA